MFFVQTRKRLRKIDMIGSTEGLLLEQLPGVEAVADGAAVGGCRVVVVVVVVVGARCGRPVGHVGRGWRRAVRRRAARWR